MTPIQEQNRYQEIAANSWQSWWVVLLLALCHALSHLDRQIINLLVAPIQESLEIGDTQFGLLQGVSFSFVYAFATLPVAWLADHGRRSRVLSGCVALWSVMTMMCGMAGNFVQLFLARCGVAIGESGLNPAALATLSDRFDQRRLPFATSLYLLAPFVGGGMALILGGALYNWLKTLDRASIPFGAGLEVWQLVFLIIGSIGIVPVLLLLLIVDRPRHKPPAGEKANLKAVIKLYLKHWRIFILFTFAMTLLLIVLSSYVSWLPATIMRSKDIDEGELGMLFGPVYVIGGVIGTLSAGLIVTSIAGQYPLRTVFRYMLTVLVLLWPIALFGLTTDSLWIELVSMGFALFLLSSVTGLSSLPFQYLAPPHLRAQVLALKITFIAMFGTGVGPVLTGFLSDNLQSWDHPLSVALTIVGGIGVPVMVMLLWWVQREYQRLITNGEIGALNGEPTP